MFAKVIPHAKPVAVLAELALANATERAHVQLLVVFEAKLVSLPLIEARRDRGASCVCMGVITEQGVRKVSFKAGRLGSLANVGERDAKFALASR